MATRSPKLPAAGPGSRVPGLLVVHVGYGLPRTGLPAGNSFRRWVVAALVEAGHRAPAELSIRLVDAAEGRELNHQYRGRDYATNVLSFPAELPPGVPSALLGDIALCVPVIAGEARERGKSERDHFAHLTIHGVLHLLGHDHGEATAAAAMEALEIRVLAHLGIGNPYE